MKVQELAMMTVASTLLARPVTARDHVRGPASAAVTLVEYGDYACPHCNQARSVVKRLLASIGDGLRFAFRNFPMSGSLPYPHHAAEAAEAAGAQNKFWEMHDLLFDHQPVLSDKHLKVYGTRVGLDMERFNQDMTQHTYALRVQEDALGASRSGVSSTPCYFINDSRHLGRCDFETLLSHIEEVT
jgi:protein-disulfide isomerase